MNFPPAGLYRKPSLSAQPGPSVSWGENVTLQCRSEIWLDTFYLSKEGSPAPPQHIHLQDTTAPSQVNFNMSPVTSDHEGTYRCYASSSTSPYLLSHPGAPGLQVRGGVPNPVLADSISSEPNPQENLTVTNKGFRGHRRVGSSPGEVGKSRDLHPGSPILSFKEKVGY